MKQSRRQFLQHAAVLSAAPFILPSRVWSADTKPNDLLTMGFIGMGKQSQHLLGAFLDKKEVRVLAVCDVDTTRREDAKKRVNEFYASGDKGKIDCTAYNDFRELIARKDIDAVCIATPDHWHTIPILAALSSGKDVYCEKPLTHNIHEAIMVLKAVDANKRVLQTGSMQRSMEEFRVACELVQNGIIGKISHVECSFGGPGIPCDLPEEAMEPGLDWETWCGPAPKRPYNSVLSPRGVHTHFPDWRKYKEYGSGAVGDWGAHHLDIAQWGLNMDASGPHKVVPPDDPKATQGAVFHYAGDIQVLHKDGFGIDFFGSEGEVKVNRGRLEFYLGGKKITGFSEKGDGGSLGAVIDKIEKEYLKDTKIKLYESRDHIRDFVDCVASRKKPITSEQVGARSAICCHLLNQSYYNHATIEWDPEKLEFANGTGKPEWLTREYRAPWSV